MTSTRTDSVQRTQAEQREQILAEAAEYLTSALPPDEVLRKLPHLLVPGFAEWASVSLRTGEDTYARIATATSDETMMPIAEEHEIHLDPEARAGVAAVIRTGRSELHPFIPEAVFGAVRDPRQARMARSANFRSALIVPLVVRGDVIGAVSAASSVPGRFGASDLTFLERFARLASISVQASRLLSELQATQERLHVVLKAAPIFLFGQDRDLRYTWAMGTTPGFTHEQVLGRTDMDLFPPEDAERLSAAKRRAMETRATVREQFHLSLPGEERDFDLTVDPEVGGGATVVGVICAAYDVTDIRRARPAAGLTAEDVASPETSASVPAS